MRAALVSTYRGAVHAYHAVTSAVSKAAHGVARFAQHHAAAIVSFATGVAVFAGCSFLTAGAGVVGCAALAGAAANGVSYAMSCGKSAAGCSPQGAVLGHRFPPFQTWILLGPLSGILGAPHTDHDFVDVAVAAGPSSGGAGAVATAAGPRLRARLARAVAGVAAGVALAVGGVASPAVAASTSVTPTAAVVAPAAVGTVTTTWHHPFYDATRQVFVDAHDLVVGDVVQTPTGTATVVGVHSYHATTTTYDLTITGLHTYYVFAGATPILVHNCGTRIDYNSDRLSNAAFEARIRSGVGDGRNVAVAQVEGLDMPVIGFSKGGGYHSENHILDQLAAQGIDPSRVIALYSERQPCPACGRLLGGTLSPGTPITWSVPWGTDAAVNRASNELLKQMIRRASGGG